MQSSFVKTGLDKLISNSFNELKGKKVGVIANHTAISLDGQHLVDILHKDKNVSLKRIFAPEHGFRGEAQDMEEISTYLDKKTGVEVFSLYGNNEKSLKPSIKILDGIDCIVYDIQDIGSRYYTYVNTLAYTMQTAAEVGAEILVLDRPNPISGSIFEGSALHTAYQSFCGYAPVCNRHGLTAGELAIMFNKGLQFSGGEIPQIDCNLNVIKCENIQRENIFSETNLPWVYPSPNMPTLECALVYPGGCLFEATNISEGRGTTKPFEVLGAPYIDSEIWIKKGLELYNQLKSSKCEDPFFLRACSFRPMFQKWAGKSCHGLQIHLKDYKKPFSYRLSLALIAAAYVLWPEEFSWRKEEYEFRTDISPIDILYGTSNFRLQLEKDPENLVSIKEEIDLFESEYRELVKEFYIY